jgi:hypothetical protein
MMAADTKTIDRIKSLRREASALEGFHAMYSEKYARDQSCDKKGYGFNTDDRFCAFTVKASFSSWAGYYGNSSCGQILSIYDRDLVQNAFVKALGIHQKELFATAARLMREEAASLTGTAEKEIAALKALLDAALADVAAAQPEIITTEAA